MSLDKAENPALRGMVALGATGLIFVAGACLLGQLNPSQARGQSPPASKAPSLTFDVVSIKPFRTPGRMSGCMFMPGRFTCKDTKVKPIIMRAYGVLYVQVSGGPAWISSDSYDIEAKESDALSAELEKLPRDQRREKQRLLLQSMLADRFHLKVRRGTKELPVYALVVGKNGPKLQATNIQSAYPGATGPDGRPIAETCLMGDASGGGDLYQGCTVAILAIALTASLGRVVLDQTELKGRYDFTLNYADQDSAAVSSVPTGGGAASDNPLPPAPSGPSVFTAVQEQLGLKLEPTKGPVDMIYIDHIDRPTEN